MTLIVPQFKDSETCRSSTFATSKGIRPHVAVEPTVAGTRIRVATILACYRPGMTVEEIVQQLFPLKPADVHDALAYAYDHLDQIESDLAADEETAVKRILFAGP